MRITTLLNKLYPSPGFVYSDFAVVPDDGHDCHDEHHWHLEVVVEPRKGSKLICSVCHKPAPFFDHLRERIFEFIPIWGKKVFFRYVMRRVKCDTCGVRVEEVPWATGKHHQTKPMMLFLAHWARKLSWKETAISFQTSWEKVYHAVEYVVSWGLENRELGPVTAIGVDEIAYSKGHKYLTLVYQIEEGCTRLLWVGKERTAESFEKFFSMLGEPLSKGIQFVCSDMWPAYLSVIKERCSNALNILDRFHIVAKMNDALDDIRAAEARRLAQDGYEPILKKSRWCVLKRKSNLTSSQRFRLRELLKYNLKTARAYLLNEDFQQFWDYESPTWAGKFLDDWCTQVMRSRIEPMKKVVGTLCRHRDLILNYFRAKKMFSSGIIEGLNNKAKVTMRKAYGYRTFRVAEISLYHTLGKLPEPQLAHRFC